MTDQQLTHLAGELQIGMRCYLHRQTGELIVFPDPEQFGDVDGEVWQEERQKLDDSAEAYLEIRPMTSREEFQMMEAFVEQITTGSVRTRLITALHQAKPFRHFKDMIDHSGTYRQEWFNFRDKQIIEWLGQQINSTD